MLSQITCHLQGIGRRFHLWSIFQLLPSCSEHGLDSNFAKLPVKQPAQHGFSSRHPHLVVHGLTPYSSLTLFLVDIFEIVGRKWTGRIPLSHACHSQKDSERLIVMNYTACSKLKFSCVVFINDFLADLDTHLGPITCSMQALRETKKIPSTEPIMKTYGNIMKMRSANVKHHLLAIRRHESQQL